MISFLCPRCRTPFSVPDIAAGKKSACPVCGQRFRITSSKLQAVNPKRRRGVWDLFVLCFAIAAASGVVGVCGLCCFIGYLGADPSKSQHSNSDTLADPESRHVNGREVLLDGKVVRWGTEADIMWSNMIKNPDPQRHVAVVEWIGFPSLRIRTTYCIFEADSQVILKPGDAVRVRGTIIFVDENRIGFMSGCRLAGQQP